MKTVCKENQCAGCMACVDVCPRNAVHIRDSLDAYNAVIDEVNCIDCGGCFRVCPNCTPVQKVQPIGWYDGWAADEIREKASSGGVASAVIKTFIEQGGYVASCLFEQGQFRFEVTNDLKRAQKFAGSKYVKSNPSGVYRSIQGLLRQGHKVLFVGLPCQVAGLKNFVKNDNHLYTMDLICHGSPSPKILSMFLRENHLDLAGLEDISFREKEQFRLSVQTTESKCVRIFPKEVQDFYTYAFLKSIDYTENCYACPYASLDRVSDITIGDSWGSAQEGEERRRGVSLILCQSEKGASLIQLAGLSLHAVDLEKAVATNHQLEHPSALPPKRGVFFKHIHRGFHKALAKCDAQIYYKKKIKALLLRCRMIGGGQRAD